MQWDNSEWEQKHAEELAQRSKDETERHQKILEAAAAEVDKFTSERAARIEAKRKQNQFVNFTFQNTHTCLPACSEMEKGIVAHAWNYSIGRRRSCSERTRRS